MIAGTHARVISYGRDGDVRYRVLDDRGPGLQILLDGHRLTVPFTGAFNAVNVAAAYATATGLELPFGDVLAALEEAPPVPGRFERVCLDNGPTAVVDYAHTPHALEHALHAARTHARGAAVWCLFGCGGDRDTAKRPAMGAVAENLADHVIVTSDNTRSESYEDICRDIARGMKQPQSSRWIEDREEAIAKALGWARDGDVVLLAGKGHERVHDHGMTSVGLSDRQIVDHIVAQRRKTA